MQTANQPFNEGELTFDEATQRFGQQTSIYRMFPGLKGNGIDNDEAVVLLNANVAKLFAKSAPTDKRRHYQLVGAQWMDKPEMFRLNSTIQNDTSSPLLQKPDQPLVSQNDERKEILAKGKTPLQDLEENGGDSPFSILAGEDRLSSTAMESFTQSPASFFNCFQCHNTQAINSHGTPVNRDPNQPKLLDAKMINVSHVFSQFVLEETQAH